MRLKFHGSLEALRDTVTLRRDKAHHKEDAGNLGVHNTSRSSRTSNHSRRSSRSTSVPDLSISDSETDVREKQLSVASIGEEVSDSVPELQDSALAGGGTGRGKGYNKGPLRADASALEGMVLDEHLAEAVRGGSGGIASFIQKAVSSGANQPQRGASFKYSVFFRPGAFNTDDSLKPGDGEDGTTHDDARSSTSGSPAVTTDKTLEHTELDDHPSMRRHMQGPQTFQMSSILVGADDGEDFRDVLPITIEEHSEESVVVTTPNVAITPVTPIAPSPGKLNTINHIHSLQASGSCATLGATSHLGSTDSLQMPTLSGRPSFVSIDSLNSLSGSAYSSRWRLDSTGSRMSSARASSGSVGRKVERPPLGPFWTNERVIRDLASKLDEELFSLLDIRPHSGEAGHAGSGPGVVLDSATPATVVTEVVDGKPQIASGTLPELVSSLASEGANDAEYLIDFLNTYRYFADAEDVARLLVWRYIDIGERATSTGKGAEWAGFLQLRVLNVFKKWTELHPLDFGQSDMLQHILTVFLQQHVSKDEKRAMFASALMKNLQERVSTVRTGSSSGSLGGSHSESFLFSPKPIAVERNRRPSAPPTTLSRALSPHVALDGSGGVRSGRRKSGLMIMSSPFGSLTAIDGGLPPLPQFPSPNQRAISALPNRF
ncbi:hypothetical protein BC832DRAFT_89176 [Gaertneriomyces semiglobifer]|nr:hypothetical protein BC832DRAFT_89176 [Gaertneriomyces semiglobifer]